MLTRYLTIFVALFLYVAVSHAALPKPPALDDKFKPKTEGKLVSIGADHLPVLKGNKKAQVLVGKKGGMLKICADGNCGNRHVKLQTARLAEVSASGKIIQSAHSFGDIEYNWTTPVHKVSNGVSMTEVKIIANIAFGASNGTGYSTNGTSSSGTFMMEVTIFNTKGKVVDGGEELDVTPGAVKYSVYIENWPWKSKDNFIVFGVSLISKLPGSKKMKKNPTKKSAGKKGSAERHELGDGIYCDSVGTATVDGVVKNISTVVTGSENFAAFEYVFPYFKNTLFYDPVFGDNFVEATGTDAPTNASTDAPITNATATEKPVTDAPVTESPAPTTETPAPTTEAPTATPAPSAGSYRYNPSAVMILCICAIAQSILL